MKYVSLHNHSEFSNLKIIDSINKFSNMINYAWELGLSGLALTDHDCLSGSFEAIDLYRQKLKSEWKNKYEDKEFPGYELAAKDLDFKVIVGNEIYLSEEGLDESQMDGKHPVHFWHLILLAKDKEGYNQLKRLSSCAWKRAWFRGILRTPTYPSDLFNIVKDNHLIASSACLGGYTAWCWKQMRETGETEFYLNKLDNHIAAMTQLFGIGNYYLELQPNEEGSEQNEYNKFMINRYWGKYPFIFTTDSHYMKEDQRELHKAFLNSKSSKDREVDEFYKYAYMMSFDEVKSLMPYLTDAQFNEMALNTERIAAQCQFYELEQKPKLATVEYEYFDKYKIDLEIFNDVDKETYPNFYYYLHTSDRADNYLARLVAHGYVNKFQDNWNHKQYYERLEEEFWTIKEVGDKIEQHMSDYFITMSKIIDLCWNEANSLVGPSRGSAGALLINYLLGITQMNPVEMDLPYVWRFLHPSRPDLPDIDFDTESDKRAAVFLAVKHYFESIGGDVVNVCTFGTEGTKSALKTAARGLKIDDDIVNYITSMIPNERGFDWSLHDCYYGNGDDRKPIKSFVEQMNQYPQLWELASSIDGLVTRLGIHASGVVCVNDDLNNYCSYMKTSKEQLVTSFDLHTLEKCGLVKYDMLTVSALDRIRQCMNYMLEDGIMKWQGSLRATYDKYLSPAVLDYDNKEMWDLAANGAISSLFQFDTTVGGQAIKKIHPTSLTQLAIANSVMRLMSDGEQPIDIYVKQKTAPEIWYADMRDNGLTNEEIKVLEKYLKVKDGVADSQEVVMQLSMDPQISGFDMKEANRLRKTIAKKQFREIEEVKKLFYEKGHSCGTRDELLNYVWNKQISMSMGYSFSTIHTTGYSIIAIQEMNLAYHYPIIYWNCACLSVDSSAINSADFYNLVDEDIISLSEENKKIQNKMDYAKLAAALDKFRNICQIDLPDINESRLSFTPDVKNNSILYGLKGISRVTEPVINEIMSNRPFSSLEDFLNKVTKRVVTKDKVINLIKSGAFNKIEHTDIKTILKKYICMISDTKNRLTMQNANMLIDNDLLPHNLETECDTYKLTKELRKHKDSNKIWYIVDSLDMPVDKINSWRNIFASSNIQGEELLVDGEPHKVIDMKSWDRFYDNQMLKIKNYIKDNHDLLLQKLNNKLIDDEYNKYCSGNEETWQLDSLNFFFNNHPLVKAIPQLELQTGIHINKINEIVEGAQEGTFFIKGKIIPKMKLYTIAGTVIDRDKVKGTVTIQCPDGVVTLKLYKDLYSTFVAVDEESGQDSFFEKGIHLLVTGVQRGSTFVPKTYKNTGRKSVMKINIDNQNNFINLEEKVSVEPGN